MKTLHKYSKRLESAKRRLAELDNRELLLRFIGHLEALGVSTGRVAKYVNHLYTLTENISFNHSKVTRKDVEKVAS